MRERPRGLAPPGVARMVACARASADELGFARGRDLTSPDEAQLLQEAEGVAE